MLKFSKSTKTLIAGFALLSTFSISALAQASGAAPSSASSLNPTPRALSAKKSHANAAAESNLFSDQADSIDGYSVRYGLRNLFDKLVDNEGNGYQDLYGTRNMRMVLTGTVYRGGANNAYNRHGTRSNTNPLPTEGLQNLCEEGFDSAVYLYSTRFNTAPVTTKCRTRKGESNTLTYFQYSPLLGAKAVHQILALIHDKLVNPSSTHPMYMHCWNGWHASGFISAVTLRQFCKMPAAQAVDYWNRNTDGNDKGSSYEKIRSMIRSFQPDPSLSIPASVQAKVCQNM